MRILFNGKKWLPNLHNTDRRKVGVIPVYRVWQIVMIALFFDCLAVVFSKVFKASCLLQQSLFVCFHGHCSAATFALCLGSVTPVQAAILPVNIPSGTQHTLRYYITIMHLDSEICRNYGICNVFCQMLPFSP